MDCLNATTAPLKSPVSNRLRPNAYRAGALCVSAGASPVLSASIALSAAAAGKGFGCSSLLLLTTFDGEGGGLFRTFLAGSLGKEFAWPTLSLDGWVVEVEGEWSSDFNEPRRKRVSTSSSCEAVSAPESLFIATMAGSINGTSAGSVFTFVCDLS